ncbi:hypothetical protein BGZ95_006070 [Linnemannia exigua]|uniref:Uncharacterized protein n=1 Tax=Linnemannia exigua TaxID=604196 RepID=A0AAD4D1B0_9FUNG|nr:hypothetical protein BGZ95_006070 [Linnemannia exigua]
MITVSTHHDFRIRPFLFSHTSSTAAALRHTKTGQICKSTRTRSNSAASRSNINHLCVLPTPTATFRREDQQKQLGSTQLSHLQQGDGTCAHDYQASQVLKTVDGDHFMGGGCGEVDEDEDEDEDVDDEDETEDVEIDIDGVGRSGYGIGNTGFTPTTTTTSTSLGNNSAVASSIHATVGGKQQLFSHEGIEFRTRSRSAGAATVAAGAMPSASAFVFGSGTGFDSSSQQQIPSLSSSVCSTSSTLSTPPANADQNYSPNNAIFPHLEHKEELVKLKREAFQELASQTQRFDDLFIAKMIHWESLCPEEKAQWLERGHSHHDDTAHNGLQQQQQEQEQRYREHQYAQQHYQPPHQQELQVPQHQSIKLQPRAQAQEQEMDDLVHALECRATVKDYSALIAFEQQAEIQRHTLMEQY